MFATVVGQDEEIKKIFYQKIKEKIERERRNVEENDDSGFFAWLFGNTAVDHYNAKRSHDDSKGSSGEGELENQMWLLLSGDSFILPNYVLEPKKDVFIQIDHTVINLKGIFLIEVKTWSGSFLASDKVWKMKQGKQWIPVGNPSKQHKRHFELFNLWLQNNIPELYPNIKECIYPVIVLKRVDWIQAKYSTIPVVSGASGFIHFVIEKGRGKLTPEMVETIVEKLRTAKPYEKKAKVENIKYKEGRTKYGKKYVRIYGTKEEADKISENYRSNHKITNVHQDKSNPNIFFFYIEDTTNKISNNKSTGTLYNIILRIGQTKFTVNGTSNTLDSPPVIKNGRTLLPIRAIIEALGGTIGWDPNERKVIVSLGSKTIELWIGKSTAKVNSVDTPIDSTNTKVVPEIINGRTMLPLRFVTENLGCDVQWNGTTKTITITYPGS